MLSSDFKVPPPHPLQLCWCGQEQTPGGSGESLLRLCTSAVTSDSVWTAARAWLSVAGPLVVCLSLSSIQREFPGESEAPALAVHTLELPSPQFPSLSLSCTQCAGAGARSVLPLQAERAGKWAGSGMCWHLATPGL